MQWHNYNANCDNNIYEYNTAHTHTLSGTGTKFESRCYYSSCWLLLARKRVRVAARATDRDRSMICTDTGTSRLARVRAASETRDFRARIDRVLRERVERVCVLGTNVSSHRVIHQRARAQLTRNNAMYRSMYGMIVYLYRWHECNRC